MKHSLTFFVVAILAVGALAREGSVDADLQSLVASERAFAATSKAKGMRTAFVAYLATDSVIFRPRAVPGKQWWEQQPDRPGLLTWYPSFAAISRGGDVGYTTGPWEFRKSVPEDKPEAHGYFFSIWKRQADGSWKVVLDIGTSNPPPPSPIPDWQPTAAKAGPPVGGVKIDVDAERAALLKADSDFAQLAGAKGPVEAYLAYLAGDAQYFRTGIFPVVGKGAIRAALPGQANPATWQPEKAEVGRSGDLGYTYGNATVKGPGADAQTQDAVYARVWQKQADGSWKVVVDMTNAVTPPAAS